MAIKTFLTNEEDRQAIINEASEKIFEIVPDAWGAYSPSYCSINAVKIKSSETIIIESIDQLFNEIEQVGIDKCKFYFYPHHPEDEYTGGNNHNKILVTRIVDYQPEHRYLKMIAVTPGVDWNTISSWYSFQIIFDNDLSRFDYGAEVLGVFQVYSTSADWTEPCLIEGTPINMADGTEKPVEELRAGDLILSYNPVTEAQTTAVVIDSYVTGYTRDFSTYSFSDGRCLTIYGQHSIYNKRSGTTKDIRNSTRDDQVINIDGEIIQWAGTRAMFIAGAKKRRYNIISSNNLYFANGILLGHKPFSKLQHMLDYRLPLSDEIESSWQSDCDIYNEHTTFIQSKEFNREMAECNQKRARSEHIIEVCKQRLINTDYKAQKHVEGLLTDEEWNEAKAKRAGWRQEINDNETILEENRKKCREIIAKYRGNKTERSMFEACCERDNAIFEVVKNYFNLNNK